MTTLFSPSVCAVKDFPESHYGDLEGMISSSENRMWKKVQQAAYTKLKTIGMPHDRQDNYTFLGGSLLSSFFSDVEAQPPAIESPLVMPEFTCTSKIVFVNGALDESLSDMADVSLDISSDMYDEFHVDIGNISDSLSLHGIVNSKQGYSLNIQGENQKIYIQNIQTETGSPCLNLSIHARPGCQADIYVVSMSTAEGAFFNGRIRMTAEKNSRINWYPSEENAMGVRFNLTTFFRVEEEAQINGTLAAANTEFSRYLSVARLTGRNATFNWNHAGLLRDQDQNHSCLRIHHQVPETFSSQTIKNILLDGARSSVDGTVYVHPDAQQVEAEQVINNLLLSDKARAFTKPNLQIYADDVKCAHGATVGQLDEDQLFYLQSRGLTQEKAFELLTGSVVASVLDKIPDEFYREYQTNRLLQQIR